MRAHLDRATIKAPAATAVLLAIALTTSLAGDTTTPGQLDASSTAMNTSPTSTSDLSSQHSCAPGSVRLNEPTALAEVDLATIDRAQVPARVAGDRGAYLDTCGAAVYVDVRDEQHDHDHQADQWGSVGAGAVEMTTQPAPPRMATTVQETETFPLQDTFALASRPGSARTIYLDFQGETVSGTFWNRDWNDGRDFTVTPWSRDDDPTFSDDELTAIQDIWGRVAEDFAPFDVNVTTTDPGADALLRAEPTQRPTGETKRVKVYKFVEVKHKVRVRVKRHGEWKWVKKTRTAWRNKTRWERQPVTAEVPDNVFGTHVLISRERPFSRPCACGGMAALDGLKFTGAASALYRYAHVFDTTASPSPAKYVAESISHEVGHTFGLSHDGIDENGRRDEYYPGVSLWAPIMGLGHSVPLSQWSQGEYDGATNGEDDFSLIARYAPVVTDDYADQIGPNATALLRAGSATGTQAGAITTRADRDVFTLNLDTARTVSITAGSVLPTGNLDMSLTLTDSAGNVIADAAPETRRTSYAIAAGHDATLSTQLDAGTYYVTIDGVGQGNPTGKGYSDYGSLGNYTLTATAQ